MSSDPLGIVVELLDRFVCDLDEERYYVSDVAVDEAWRQRGMFNVLLLDSGWKVDLILRKDRPFSRSEFEWRIRVDLAGASIALTSSAGSEYSGSSNFGLESNRRILNDPS